MKHPTEMRGRIQKRSSYIEQIKWIACILDLRSFMFSHVIWIESEKLLVFSVGGLDLDPLQTMCDKKFMVSMRFFQRREGLGVLSLTRRHAQFAANTSTHRHTFTHTRTYTHTHASDRRTCGIIGSIDCQYPKSYSSVQFSIWTPTLINHLHTW